MDIDRQYFERRAREEVRRAAAAADPMAERIHAEMAKRYLAAAQDASGRRPLLIVDSC